MSKLEAMRERFAAARADLKANSQEAVKEWLEGWLSRNPKVLAVRWTQYTPWFNDGDPCVFGVNEPEFKIEGVCEDEFEYAYSLKKNEGAEGIRELSDKIQDDDLREVMLAAFDDHVEVVVTRGSIVTSVYQHD
jgi:hypothetical protein